jgi:Tol biopolymer transport system component
MGARTQISFEDEPVAGGSWAPKTADVLLVEKDVGGSEFYQLYTLKDGQLALLTDGKSRNQFSTWSGDGKLIAYSSTKRNGADSDLYVMDPRDPSTARMVAQVQGGGWAISAFAPDNKSAIVGNYRSITDVDLYRLDLATGALTPIGNTGKEIAYGQVDTAADGTLWVLSDEGSDVQRLGTLDPATGKFTPRGPAETWDVESFKISSDGRFIAYVVNEAGISRVRLLDPATGKTRTVEALPAGVVGAMEVSNWGEIGLSLSSARSPSDAYSINPETLAVTRWSASETGGLDAAKNVEPRSRALTASRCRASIIGPMPRSSPASARC